MMRMCLSVCPSVCVSTRVTRKLRGRTSVFVRVACRHGGPPLAALVFAINYSTSGFADDDKLSYNGPMARHVYF